MSYKVKFKDKSFKIEDVNTGKMLVQLKIKSVWSTEALFDYMGHAYHIKTANSWGSKFDILREDTDVGDIDYNWKGEIIIRIKNNDGFTKHFILTQPSMWKSKFLLKDFLTNHQFFITPIYSWKTLNYDYLIEVGDEPELEEHPNNVDEVLLLSCTMYAIRLYMMMAGAAS